MKTLTRVRRRAPRARRAEIWIWTSKIMPDLWLVDLFCPIKKNFHTPPYWVVDRAVNLVAGGRLESSHVQFFL